MFSLPSSALSLRRRSFIKKSMDSFGDDSCTVVEESSLPFDGDEDRPTSVVLHEPPKTYSAAPEPRRSALRAQSVCGSNERKDRSLGDESCVPRVRFGNVHIHTHGVELGYNPSVSWGPPLELSWDVISVEEYDIDSYEKTRNRRGCKKLSKAERRRRLYRAGFSRSAVKAVESSLHDDFDDDDDDYCYY